MAGGVVTCAHALNTPVTINAPTLSDATIENRGVIAAKQATLSRGELTRVCKN